MNRLAIVLLVGLLGGCAAPDRSTRALEDAGFSNVEIKGWSLWGCSKDDTFCTAFEADNPNGRRVSGVVGCGWLKGCTVRL